jgi:hypothetical protein
MSRNNTVLSALFASIMLLLSAVLIETAIAQVPIRIGPATTTRPGSKPQQEPCWEVAGVSKSALQQRRAISQRTRQEVEGVCSNSALSIQQKRQEIQQIRQRERQEIETIITPAQQEAMRSCQEQRHPVASGGGHVGAGGGPCGEMPVGHKPNPQPEEDEMPPNDAAHPN